MSGALLALSGAPGAPAGGGTPSTMTWGDAYGSPVAVTSTQTVSGIPGGGTATFSVRVTGGAGLYVIQNGASTAYAGPFTVANGDTLAFTLVGPSRSGTVTITSGATTIATFDYVTGGVEP